MKLLQNYSRLDQIIFDYKDRPFIKNSFEQLRYAKIHKTTWRLLNDADVELIKSTDTLNDIYGIK